MVKIRDLIRLLEDDGWVLAGVIGSISSSPFPVTRATTWLPGRSTASSSRQG
jgi:hypothetical protein